MGRTYENRKAAMAKTQGLKTKVYSKYGKEIYVCAKNGGADPDSNLSLRRMIEKAKKDQVPGHVIDRAIEKAQGGAGENYAPARYEGFGPGNCMVIVDCLTDNNNRTFGDVRTCFNKSDSKLGAPGAVSHMFDHRAVFVFKGEDEDAVLEALMAADVDVADIESEEGAITALYTVLVEGDDVTLVVTTRSGRSRSISYWDFTRARRSEKSSRSVSPSRGRSRPASTMESLAE